MLPAVPIETAIKRLEVLLPGLAAFAMARFRAYRAALHNRAGFNRPLPKGEPPREGIILDVDALLEHARELSATVDGGRTEDPLLRIAELLVDLDGDTVLVVTDSLKCYQHPVDEFLRLLHCDVVNLSGDLLCVATSSPRVIVLHHEGWVFDVRVAAE